MRLCISTSSHQLPFTRALALALSSALSYAANWLNGNDSPIYHAGSSPSGPGVPMLLTYWLGVPFTASPTPALNATTQLTLLEWRQQGQNHSAIRDVIFSAARSAALAPSKEMPNLIFDSLQA